MNNWLTHSKQYHRENDRWVFIFPKSGKRKGQCRVIYCKRPARVQVRAYRQGFRAVQHSVCITCASRLYRLNYPAKEAYRQIKDRAERRKQIFTITYEDFLAIPRIDEYLACRGRGLEDLHLDRKKVHLGYVPGNLQVLTAEENLRKQREVDYPNEPF